MSIKLFYGMPGMGKTTLMHDYVRAHPQHRFFIIEHSDEWLPDSIMWRGHPPKPIEVVDKIDNLPQELPEAGAWVFYGVEANEVAYAAIARGNVVFVDDELDMLARYKGWEQSPLRHMVHRGRHFPNDRGEICELHILGACRRPQNLATDLTDLADEVFSFRVQGKGLQRLLDDSMLEQDEWDTVRTLPKFVCRHWPSGRYLKLAGFGEGQPKQEDPDEPISNGVTEL